VAERFVIPLKPGTLVEGRNLSSRQTQYVVKDLEIGQPINSDECSETADGVAVRKGAPKPDIGSEEVFSWTRPCTLRRKMIN
jgi:hypothetical protein